MADLDPLYTKAAIIAVAKYWTDDITDLSIRVPGDAPNRPSVMVQVTGWSGERKHGINIQIPRESLVRDDEMVLRRIIEDACRYWTKAVGR